MAYVLTGLLNLLRSSEGKHADVATKGLNAVDTLAYSDDMSAQLGSLGAAEG